ncbi:class I glutamine amidotransferase-like protein [Canariomyces notabilis]|uniref:Class I glutamine amidotransferase-like protein n=1 Tax=Canariomyces notabilis TaxID=2074819 RepID=A0AAN6T8H1_9PEZI|nr:class I glutamine amidotransferase-like protein [Canariomyces arenarius]
MPPLRLAILEADTPVPAANARYKGYFGVFKHLFERAVSPTTLDSIVTLTGHDVVHNPSSAYPSLDSIDAILITGSKHDAFADDEWILTLVEYVRKALVHPRVRVVGVCFGHQIVSRALGALVARSDKGWEVSVTETRLTEKGKELFGGRETLKIQQMHRDQVFNVPAGAELLASTDKCMNHGFVIPKRVITVQGHPEFTEDIMREILELRHETGLLTDEVFQSGMERNGDDHDGVLMAQVFLKFLQEQ